MKTIVLSVIFIFVLQSYTVAQNKPQQKSSIPKTSQAPEPVSPNPKPYSFYWEMNMEMGIPVREFASATNSLPFGMSSAFLFQPSNDIPIMFGFDVGYMNMGSISRYKTLTADIKVGNTVMDQLVIPVRIQIDNNIFNSHFIFRSMIPTKYVSLFAEGVVGFNNFWTSTVIYDDSPEHYLTYNESSNEIARDNQVSDVAISYGGGGGMLIELGKIIFVNLRADYLFGGEAAYFDKSQTQFWNVEITDPFSQSSSGNYSQHKGDIKIQATPKTSRTDMFLLNAGIAFKF